MIDRGLEKLLMVIFGAGGIVIFVYVLSQPMLAHERVSAIIIGSFLGVNPGIIIKVHASEDSRWKGFIISRVLRRRCVDSRQIGEDSKLGRQFANQVA